MPVDEPAYLDCNATAPIDPRIAEVVRHYQEEEFGNAGSRTHEFGAVAKRAVQRAREQVARVVEAKPDEVFFTSGATESNNLALLGLAHSADAHGSRHIVTTAIEHKAVLEPAEVLQGRGFEVTIVPPTGGGWVDPDVVLRAVRSDTLAVSVMQVNNETGVIQPISEIAAGLSDHPAYFHVDAAQGFGKELEALRSSRVDLVSVSGHKLFAPKGVGALVARRRGFERPPLAPLFYGGGQERGLRPGTLPVPLIAGLGLAAKLAVEEAGERRAACREYRATVFQVLEPLGFCQNGDESRCASHVLNLSFPGVDSEALMVALKGLVAISNGSACTSSSYEPSHVLTAMGCDRDQIAGAVRLSWCYMTKGPDWSRVAEAIRGLL